MLSVGGSQLETALRRESTSRQQLSAMLLVVAIMMAATYSIGGYLKCKVVSSFGIFVEISEFRHVVLAHTLMHVFVLLGVKGPGGVG